MAKAKLSEKQLIAIEKRLLAGEKASHLAVEYGVTEGAIRKRFGAKVRIIKEVANQVFEAEKAFESLDYSTKFSTQLLINELRETSLHLARAGNLGAKTAHRLAELAHKQLDSIDVDNVADSSEALQLINGLTNVSNNAAKTGIDLIKANKETKEDAPKGDKVSDLVNSLHENNRGLPFDARP